MKHCASFVTTILYSTAGLSVLQSATGFSSSFNTAPSLLSSKKTLISKKYRDPSVATQTSTSLYLVTEDEVIAAVEKAELLWSDALEAREKSDLLSTEAEEEAVSAETTTTQSSNVIKMVESTKSFGQSQIDAAQNALDAGFEATSKVTSALDAANEADALEALAEEALAASEKVLEQHLIDFPENDE